MYARDRKIIIIIVIIIKNRFRRDEFCNARWPCVFGTAAVRGGVGTENARGGGPEFLRLTIARYHFYPLSFPPPYPHDDVFIFFFRSRRRASFYFFFKPTETIRNAVFDPLFVLRKTTITVYLVIILPHFT